MIGAVCVYLNQLSNTVASNLMSTVDEISQHDVESIEGTLNNSYARLRSIAVRMEVYDIRTVPELQEQLGREAASSALFEAFYFLDDAGNLYGSTGFPLSPEQHVYGRLFEEGDDEFAMLYDPLNGKLDAVGESLVYGIRIPTLVMDDTAFVAVLACGSVANIRDQLLIESFNGQGVSSVVNATGSYIVRGSAATEITGQNNFYDMLRRGTLDDGVTIEEIHDNIAAGESFVINCTTADGEHLILSFAPVESTSWAFIMAVQTSVFDQRFTPFVIMTAVMMTSVVIVIIVMMALIYRFMRRSVAARAESVARAEFLSNMSHEIRTPLNGIIGINHLMAESLDDRETMARYVYKLGNAANYLLSLVNDILDVSKLQAGKVVLTKEPFDIAAVIENVSTIQHEAMEDRGIDFALMIDDLDSPCLVGDEVRVSQILMNVLSNAVKFTPEGGSITVAATQELLETSRRVRTRISIMDTGCGMTPEFQHHLFEAFSQERNSNSDSQKGTGLGMAISHMLVKEMGGMMEVESRLGEGTRFTIILDLMPDATKVDLPIGDDYDAVEVPRATYVTLRAAEDVLVRSKTESVDVPKPVKFLVAEDNELNAEILLSILKREGYETALAENGRLAVDMFASSEVGEFTGILMDAQMPVMDGYEASREIRDLDRADAKTVRIFACTASTFAEDRSRAMESGMDDFLAKPLDVPDMLEKLKRLTEEG